MSGQLQESVQNFLLMLVTGVLGALGAFLIALVKKGLDWLQEKISKIKVDKQRDSLKEAISVLETVVVNTVNCLQQTLGEEIRKSIKEDDGKYTREDLLKLKNIAFEMIKSQLSDSTVEILNGTFDDLKAFIESMIETQVYYTKNSYNVLETSEIEL